MHGNHALRSLSLQPAVQRTLQPTSGEERRCLQPAGNVPSEKRRWFGSTFPFLVVWRRGLTRNLLKNRGIQVWYGDCSLHCVRDRSTAMRARRRMFRTGKRRTRFEERYLRNGFPVSFSRTEPFRRPVTGRLGAEGHLPGRGDGPTAFSSCFRIRHRILDTGSTCLRFATARRNIGESG
jgi:hypothetical protein